MTIIILINVLHTLCASSRQLPAMMGSAHWLIRKHCIARRLSTWQPHHYKWTQVTTIKPYAWPPIRVHQSVDYMWVVGGLATCPYLDMIRKL